MGPASEGNPQFSEATTDTAMQAGVALETPLPPSRRSTVAMLNWAMPLARNDVSAPCGLSWMNRSICGASCKPTGIAVLLLGGELTLVS
jgi:hypothetical protein